jgi:hypothetical protein
MKSMRMLLLVVLFAAAGASLAASSDSLNQWFSISAISFTTTNAGTAVPEPDYFAMCLASLGMMGLIARRRKR